MGTASSLGRPPPPTGRPRESAGANTARVHRDPHSKKLDCREGVGKAFVSEALAVWIFAACEEGECRRHASLRARVRCVRLADSTSCVGRCVACAAKYTKTLRPWMPAVEAVGGESCDEKLEKNISELSACIRTLRSHGLLPQEPKPQPALSPAQPRFAL